MKQNLRKFLAVLVMTVSVLGLTACGTAEETLAYDEANLKATADIMINSWNAMSAEEINYWATLDKEDAAEQVEYMGIPYTAEAVTSSFTSFGSSMEELGAYVSTNGSTVEAKADEIIYTVHMTYEQRDVDVSFTMNKKGVVETVLIAPTYTIGEILTKAGLNTVLGMGVVFAVLIFLSLLIYCFNFIPLIQNMFSKKKEAAPAAPAKTAAPAPAPAPAAEELVDDCELVAAITAAICAYSGTSSDGFVVRSIRRADSAKWKRA